MLSNITKRKFQRIEKMAKNILWERTSPEQRAEIRLIAHKNIDFEDAHKFLEKINEEKQE